MPAALPRPSQKISVRVFSDDYAFMTRRLAGRNITPTELLRELGSAWVKRERDLMMQAAAREIPATSDPVG